MAKAHVHFFASSFRWSSLLVLSVLCDFSPRVHGQPTSAPTWSNTIIRPARSNLFLSDNEYISSGEGIYLPTYKTHFRQEANGNLVMFRELNNGGTQLLWDSGAMGEEGQDYFTILQGNGDLITWQGTRENPVALMWKTGTALGTGDYFLGLMVIPGGISTRFAIFRGTGPLDVEELEWTSDELGNSYTYVPTIAPTDGTEPPTPLLSASPTVTDSASPTVSATESPTVSVEPSMATPSPTRTISEVPTTMPTKAPTQATPSPTVSKVPSATPTNSPTGATNSPTGKASSVPSNFPSTKPTSAPTKLPSTSPTLTPTLSGSQSPSTSFLPTESVLPTDVPSVYPSWAPSPAPSVTAVPTKTASDPPSLQPTITPVPTVNPTVAVARDCSDICVGSYPFGCAPQQEGTVKYACLPVGGCYYTSTMGAEYPPGSNACTYKVDGGNEPPSTGGGTSNPTPAPTFTPKEDCNGVCQGTFPFGCSENIPGAVKYGCNKNGGCFYGDDHAVPYPAGSEACTYKIVIPADAPGASAQPSTTPSSAPTLLQEDCTGRCPGEYPFGCAEFVGDSIKYACNAGGGCLYREAIKDEIGSDWCLYKLDVTLSPTMAPTDGSGNRNNESSSVSWKQQSQTLRIVTASIVTMAVGLVL
mmetsp:Transcript_27038/g.41474  ORF Transcript_27038/g.41474 Transcript_27038/m.41474 type:complete len:644 (-) Transcript_27038:2473-4404(-)